MKESIDAVSRFVCANLSAFLISLLATVVGILIVLALERQRRPRLTMKIGKTYELPENDLGGRKQCRWPHVEVHNRKIPRWLSWVFDGDPAFACRAWIAFYPSTGDGRIFHEEMAARWSEADQPRIVQIPGPTGVVGAAVEAVQHAIDIPTGECMTIAPVYRAKVHDACYGWNNESYLYGFEHPSWQLDKGRYMARIRVLTGGREFVDVFRVVNDASFNDFRLEDIDEDTKRKLR